MVMSKKHQWAAALCSAICSLQIGGVSSSEGPLDSGASNDQLDFDETRLLRFPDIHGGLIAFTHGGDIWTVSSSGGGARRVTSHPGLELFPKFSPDGKWIAFTGQYDGDEQVYVIPAIGGEPIRLTSYPARGPLPARWGYDNQVYGWTPDGNAVLFRSHRDHFNVTDSRLYAAPLNGGLPSPLPMVLAGAGDYSPDGKSMIFSPIFRDFRTWKRYEGGWAQDLWAINLETHETTNVTNDPRTDRDPMWTDNGIYFVSDRDDHLNLYALDSAGAARQLTTHASDVRWASADRAGAIVYELDGALRVFNTATNKDRAVSIFVPDDGIHTRSKNISVADQIRSFSISPNGARAVFAARGDIYSAPLKSGVTRNLTRSSDAHDRNAKWSAKGARIAYVSDQSGEEEIWVADAKGDKPPHQVTSSNRLRFYRLEWSPKGDKIAVGDMKGRLYVVDIRSGHLTKIGEMGAWYNQDFSWSPDGRYVAFSALNPNFMRSIHIWSEDGGRDQSVTDERFNSFSPAWDSGGDYLYFLSDREFSPQIGSSEWNYAVDRETAAYAIALTPTAQNPFSPKNAEADEKTESNEDEQKDAGRIEIEFNKLQDRLIRVPIEADNFDAIAAFNNKLVLFRTGPFYYGRESDVTPAAQVFSIKDRKLRTVTKTNPFDQQSTDISAPVTAFDLTPDGRFFLVERRNAYMLYDLSDGNLSPKPVSTDGLRATIAPRQEWANIFDETWRRFRDFFYVENMHGYDWEALRQKYRPLLKHAAHRSDLNYLIGEMIAELNVGHAYVFGGDRALPDRPDAGLLGARFEYDAKADAYKISDILKGDNAEQRYRAPLAEFGVDVGVGDYVIDINGRELNREITPYETLRTVGGEPVELTVNNTASRNGAHKLIVDPVASERNLIYYDWVRKNRERVDELSNGRIGYLHIPNMSADGIREFIKWYYGQIRKDGLLIDVRGNGGGNVSQMIMERLLRPHYSNGYVQGERFPRTYPWGVGGAKVFTGELAVLANERTLSDGDAFTWTFKQTKRGPIIGRRTWGGVIGIDNTGQLLDGGGVFVPQFAFADSKGRWVVEGEGVAPDIDVENDPASLIEGVDPQLERGVFELLQQIGDRSPGTLTPAQEAPVKSY